MVLGSGSGIGVKKAARNLPIRRRGEEALSANEQVTVRKIKQTILVCLSKIDVANKEEDEDMLEEWTRKLSIFQEIYCKLVLFNQEAYDAMPSFNRTIDSFGKGSHKILFRFNPEELRELLDVLEIPTSILLENGCVMPGEEMLLRGLYELVSGDTQYRIALSVFGGDHSLQSRAFKYFCDFTYTNFKCLVEDNLDWWERNGLLEESRQAIWEKMKEVDGFEYPEDYVNLVCLFIDCNCLRTSVVGGGPAEGGANAIRWSSDIQEAFYNGWKSIHGLKHQTADAAHGLTVDMCGPTALRRNDLTLLRMSDLNDRLGRLTGLYIFGDSAYKTQSNISTYIKKESMPVGWDHWNYAMKTVRISIEWNYGYTASLFAYLAKPQKLKVMKSDRVSKIYTVGTLFRNFHNICYGSQTSLYFGVNFAPNFLRHYVKQTDLD